MAKSKVVIKDDGSRGKVGTDSGRVFDADDARVERYVDAIRARSARTTVATTTTDPNDDGTVERVERPRGTK